MVMMVVVLPAEVVTVCYGRVMVVPDEGQREHRMGGRRREWRPWIWEGEWGTTRGSLS